MLSSPDVMRGESFGSRPSRLGGDDQKKRNNTNLGFRVEGLGLWVWGLGFRVQGLRRARIAIISLIVILVL